jgi:hypothetical protein
MKTQTIEHVKQETKKKDYDSMTAVEMIREFRKDPKIMEEAKRVASMV